MPIPESYPPDAAPYLLDVLGNIQKKINGKAVEPVHNPRKGQNEHRKNGHDLGDEGQGHFLNLGGRLNDADNDAHSQAHAQHGQGHGQGQFNGLPGKANDEFLGHDSSLPR